LSKIKSTRCGWQTDRQTGRQADGQAGREKARQRFAVSLISLYGHGWKKTRGKGTKKKRRKRDISPKCLIFSIPFSFPGLQNEIPTFTLPRTLYFVIEKEANGIPSILL
jgi:hypothetical protein